MGPCIPARWHSLFRSEGEKKALVNGVICDPLGFSASCHCIRNEQEPSKGFEGSRLAEVREVGFLVDCTIIEMIQSPSFPAEFPIFLQYCC